MAAQVVDALLALAAGDPDGAAAAARAAAAADPGARLPPLLAAQLAGPGGRGCTTRRAFAAFISGGGNVGLYAATIATLRAWHERRARWRWPTSAAATAGSPPG